MAKISNVNKAIEEAKTGGYVITDKKTNKKYSYGDNSYIDMQIENACFVDMFPEEVKDVTDYFGFNREDYVLEKAVELAIICQSCNDNTTDYLNHTLTSNQGKITVCDFCYQELSTLRKQGNEWVESLSLDGVEYRQADTRNY